MTEKSENNERARLKEAAIEAHRQGPSMVKALVEKRGDIVLNDIAQHREVEANKKGLNRFLWIAVSLLFACVAALVVSYRSGA